jgi:hypothetical protein
MIAAGHVHELLRELDAVLRVVAPVEHPAGASPLVLTFAELDIEPDFVPRLHGLAARNLDTFAAWLRHDESLVGRPVMALALDRVIPSATFAGRLDRDHALNDLRYAALHELAHSVAHRAEAPVEQVKPAEFQAWLRGKLSAVAPADLFASPTAHDLNWWARYVVATARLATAAPRVYSAKHFSAAAQRYGYADQHDATEWISAAQADGQLFVGSIIDAATRRNQELSRLLDDIRPPTAEPVSAAASQET